MSSNPESSQRSSPVPSGARASLALGGACVAAFVASSWFGGGGVDVLTLICCGAKDRELIVGGGEWWRLVSAGFLHAGVFHLLVNMAALYALGPVVERLWGSARFLLIYLAALVGGNLASLLGTPIVSVGASGAIFGLFGAVVVFSTVHRRFLAPGVRRGLWARLAIMALLQVAVSLAIPFIDHAAHLGGLVAGALVAVLLQPVPARTAAASFGGTVVTLLAVAALSATIWAAGMAVDYARLTGSAVMTLGKMEQRTLGGDDGFTISVPRDWEYEAPAKDGQAHVFIRRGVAVISVRAIPPSQGAGVAAVAATIETQWAKEGAKLLARHDIPVGDQEAVELLFRQEVRGMRQRRREVVFSTWSGRLFHVSCVCLEARYRVLEILFDSVLHSIRMSPPRPGASDAQAVWQRFSDHPRDPDACVALATCYIHEGRLAAAERLLRMAVSLRPSHAEAHNQLAVLYATARPPLRQPALAVRHALKAVAAGPSSPAYLAALAVACEAAGDRAKALDAARRAAELAPDDATYADLLKRLGQ